MADTRAQAMSDVDGEVAPIMVYKCRECSSDKHGGSGSEICRLIVLDCRDNTTRPFDCPFGCAFVKWEHVKGA